MSALDAARAAADANALGDDPIYQFELIDPEPDKVDDVAQTHFIINTHHVDLRCATLESAVVIKTKTSTSFESSLAGLHAHIEEGYYLLAMFEVLHKVSTLFTTRFKQARSSPTILPQFYGMIMEFLSQYNSLKSKVTTLVIHCLPMENVVETSLKKWVIPPPLPESKMRYSLTWICHQRGHDFIQDERNTYVSQAGNTQALFREFKSIATKIKPLNAHLKKYAVHAPIVEQQWIDEEGMLLSSMQGALKQLIHWRVVAEEYLRRTTTDDSEQERINQHYKDYEDTIYQDVERLLAEPEVKIDPARPLDPHLILQEMRRVLAEWFRSTTEIWRKLPHEDKVLASSPNDTLVEEMKEFVEIEYIRINKEKHLLTDLPPMPEAIRGLQDEESVPKQRSTGYFTTSRWSDITLERFPALFDLVDSVLQNIQDPGLRLDADFQRLKAFCRSRNSDPLTRDLFNLGLDSLRRQRIELKVKFLPIQREVEEALATIRSVLTETQAAVVKEAANVASIELQPLLSVNLREPLQEMARLLESVMKVNKSLLTRVKNWIKSQKGTPPHVDQWKFAQRTESILDISRRYQFLTHTVRRLGIVSESEPYVHRACSREIRNYFNRMTLELEYPQFRKAVEERDENNINVFRECFECQFAGFGSVIQHTGAFLDQLESLRWDLEQVLACDKSDKRRWYWTTLRRRFEEITRPSRDWTEYFQALDKWLSQSIEVSKAKLARRDVFEQQCITVRSEKGVKVMLNHYEKVGTFFKMMQQLLDYQYNQQILVTVGRIIEGFNRLYDRLEKDHKAEESRVVNPFTRPPEVSVLARSAPVEMESLKTD